MGKVSPLSPGGGYAHDKFVRNRGERQFSLSQLFGHVLTKTCQKLRFLSAACFWYLVHFPNFLLGGVSRAMFLSNGRIPCQKFKAASFMFSPLQFHSTEWTYSKTTQFKLLWMFTGDCLPGQNICIVQNVGSSYPTHGASWSKRSFWKTSF